MAAFSRVAVLDAVGHGLVSEQNGIVQVRVTLPERGGDEKPGVSDPYELTGNRQGSEDHVTARVARRGIYWSAAVRSPVWWPARRRASSPVGPGDERSPLA